MSENTPNLFADLGFGSGLWMDGAWRGDTSELEDVRNPATGESITRVSLASPADFGRAIDGAQKAFAGWSNQTAAARGEVLKRAASLMAARRQSLAGLLTREQGKPLSQALGEVDYAASFFLWFGEQARRLTGRIQPHPVAGFQYRVNPVPAGVVGLVTPWNFPLAQGAKKLSAALACGCTAVWKPSELTPLVALAMGPLLKEAGVPDGAVQILPAMGPVAGAALTADARVRVLSLTGSTQTGRTLIQASARHLQRLSLELGGNAPFIVMPDADLDLAAADLVKLKMLCSGQVCVTANRVFVPASAERGFLERLVALWSKLRIGNGLSMGVDAGPLIHDRAVKRVRALVEDAVRHGASIVAENRSHEAHSTSSKGSFFAPMVLRGVTDDLALAQEEIFGPVAPILTYTDVDDVLRRANSTPFGLAGYVYGSDLAAANAVAGRLHVGIVGVNEWRPLRAEIPFGGVKYSGFGKEGGEEGILEFCDSKVISSPVAKQG